MRRRGFLGALLGAAAAPRALLACVPGSERVLAFDGGGGLGHATTLSPSLFAHATTSIYAYKTVWTSPRLDQAAGRTSRSSGPLQSITLHISPRRAGSEGASWPLG